MLITSSPTFGYKQRSTIPKNSQKTIHPNFLLYSAPILPYTRLGYATHHCFLGFINPCVLPAPDTKTPQAFYSSSKRNTNNLILLLVLHPKCLQRYYATLLQILQYHFWYFWNFISPFTFCVFLDYIFSF